MFYSVSFVHDTCGCSGVRACVCAGGWAWCALALVGDDCYRDTTLIRCFAKLLHQAIATVRVQITQRVNGKEDRVCLGLHQIQDDVTNQRQLC